MTLNLREKEKQNNKDAIGKFMGFFLFRHLINKYTENRSLHINERKKIKKYGIISIILSSVAIIVSLSCLITSLMNLQFQGASLILIMLVSILGCVVIPFFMSAYALVFAILQVRLNRKSIGIVGIILSVLSAVSCIVLIIFLII